MRLRDFRKQVPDYSSQSLDKMLTALDNISNRFVAENEKAVLDSLQVLTTDAQNFTDQSQFENLKRSIEDIESNWLYSSPVTQSNVDAYKKALNSIERNFQANNAIMEGVEATRKALSGLNQETSKDLPEILASLDKFTESHIKFADKHVQRQLELEKDEIRDAIWVADRLNRMDISEDDIGYGITEGNIDSETGLAYFLNGDHKEARKYLNRGIKIDERDLFKTAGKEHQDQINTAVATLKRVKGMYKTLDNQGVEDSNRLKDLKNMKSKGIFAHVPYIPKSGAFKLNTNNIATNLEKWDNLIANIMNDKTIKWNPELYDAYHGKEGSSLKGVDGLYNKLEQLVSDDLGYSTVNKDGEKSWDSSMIAPVDIVEYLNQNVQWMEDKSGLMDWPGYTEPLTGANFTGAELFMNLINVRRGLDNSINLINDYRSKGIRSDFGGGTSGVFEAFDLK